jgi:putative FmdB family regulatory protein
MPIYEFRCKHCGNVFEYLCIHSDGKNAVTCPSCGEKESEKLLSAFSTVSSNSNQGLGHNLAASNCSSKGGFS